ncbi:putative MFS transporter superfamily [Plasmopara halstedii]
MRLVYMSAQASTHNCWWYVGYSRYALLLGLGELGNIHALSYCTILWGLNGLIQSSGNVSVMGKWFNENERGAVLGIWSGNGCLGNTVVTVVVASMFALVEKALAWKIALVVAAGLDSKDVAYRYERSEDAKPDVAIHKDQTELM